MEEDKPRFYKISEVATRWNKTIDEVLLIVECFNLEAVCLYSGDFLFSEDYPSRGEKIYKFEIVVEREAWFQINRNSISSLRLYGRATFSGLRQYWDVSAVDPGDEETLEELNLTWLKPVTEIEYNGKPAWKTCRHEITKDDVAFTDIEIARIEKENPSLFVKSDLIHPASNTTTHDPKDQAEITSLAAEHAKALQKENHKGYKPSGGWIAYLAKWVQENAPEHLEMTSTTCKRIAIIANPDKSKGPGATKG
jgi:hypothetical protein